MDTFPGARSSPLPPSMLPTTPRFACFWNAAEPLHQGTITTDHKWNGYTARDGHRPSQHHPYDLALFLSLSPLSVRPGPTRPDPARPRPRPDQHYSLHRPGPGRPYPQHLLRAAARVPRTSSLTVTSRLRALPLWPRAPYSLDARALTRRGGTRRRARTALRLSSR